MNIPQKMKAVSTSGYIYQILRDDILKLKLTPGLSISEKEISESMKVSRTPVREAFLKLAQEGLLEIYPQKGSFVSLIDLMLVEEARFMRETLEKAVVKQAYNHFPNEKLIELEMNLRMQEMCKKQKDFEKLFELDENFHQTIFEGCNKRRTWNLIQQMNADFKRIRMLRLATDYNWNDIYDHHSLIVKAIKEKDLKLADQTMHEHLNMVLFDKEELREKYPDYFKEIENN